MSDYPVRAKTKILHAAILLAVAIVLIMGCLYPLRQLVIDDIKDDLSMLHRNVASALQKSQPAVVAGLNQRLSNWDVIKALKNNDIGPLEDEISKVKLLEPRLISAYWMGVDNDHKRSLMGDNKVIAKKIPNYLTSLMLRAYQMPKGHGLLEFAFTDNHRISLFLLHNLSNIGETNMGIVLLEFNIDNALLNLEALLPENSPYAFVLLDRYTNIIARVGNSYVDELTQEDILQRFNRFEFNSDFLLDKDAWYKNSLVAYRNEDSDIFEQIDWKILIRLSEVEVNQHFYRVFTWPLISIVGASMVLFWFVWNGFLPGFRRHRLANTAATGIRAALPEKVYEWSYEGIDAQIIHAPTLFMASGYDFGRVDVMDGTLIKALMSDEDVERVGLIAKDLQSGSEVQFDIDLRLRHKLGYWLWFNVRGRVEQRDKKGRIALIRGLCIDITKRKQDEKMILTALQEADQSNQLKSEFIANISHEVRTPINAILGYLQLMPVSEKNTQFIDKSRDAINLLLSRFNQIVVYSQLEHGALELDLQPVQMVTLIDEIIADVTEQILEGRCDFNASVDSTLAEWYLMDPDSLKLLVNLLVRTIAALGELDRLTIVVVNNGRTKRAHTVQFELRATCDTRLVNRLNIVFSNNFEHASQIELGGSNIDLALARKLVQRLNSDLTIENFATGTSFIFSADLNIPDVYHRKQVDKLLAVEQSAKPKAAVDIAGIRILIVEDNATNREVIGQILGKMGVVVDVAENGAIAVEKLRQNNMYQMIFMDLQMPVMDGLEATRIIRKELGLSDIPIVAVTANQFNIDRELAIEAGMDDFLAKPVNSEQLRRSITKWVSGDRPHADLRAEQDGVAEPVEAEVTADPGPPEGEGLAINPEATLRRMAGEDEMLLRIYKRYVADFAHWNAQLTQLFNEQRWVEAKMHAHTLKGAAGNLDATVLAALAAELEHLLKQSPDDQQERLRLQGLLRQEHLRVDHAIKEFLAQHEQSIEVTALQDDEIVETLALLEQLLQRKKRLPQDKVEAVKAYLAGTPQSDNFADFIDACHGFDFDRALSELEKIASAISLAE